MFPISWLWISEVAFLLTEMPWSSHFATVSPNLCCAESLAQSSLVKINRNSWKGNSSEGRHRGEDRDNREDDEEDDELEREEEMGKEKEEEGGKGENEPRAKERNARGKRGKVGRKRGGEEEGGQGWKARVRKRTRRSRERERKRRAGLEGGWRRSGGKEDKEGQWEKRKKEGRRWWGREAHKAQARSEAGFPGCRQLLFPLLNRLPSLRGVDPQGNTVGVSRLVTELNMIQVEGALSSVLRGCETSTELLHFVMYLSFHLHKKAGLSGVGFYFNTFWLGNSISMWTFMKKPYTYSTDEQGCSVLRLKTFGLEHLSEVGIRRWDEGQWSLKEELPGGSQESRTGAGKSLNKGAVSGKFPASAWSCGVFWSISYAWGYRHWSKGAGFSYSWLEVRQEELTLSNSSSALVRKLTSPRAFLWKGSQGHSLQQITANLRDSHKEPAEEILGNLGSTPTISVMPSLWVSPKARICVGSCDL